MTQIITYDVIIDAGHGGIDSGAVSGNGKEKDFTLKISIYQAKRLKEMGLKVGLTRDKDVTLENATRTRIAKMGTYCISNHLNAGGGDRCEVIHSIHDDGVFANKIADALNAVGQTTDRVYSRKGNDGDYYYMHRETGITKTFIVEYCFIDNDADFKHFNENWESYAESVVKAFCEQAKVLYRPLQKEETKPTPTQETFYRVVVGSYKDEKNAKETMIKLAEKGFTSFIDIYKK